MEKLKRLRTTYRQSFSKIYNGLNTELNKDIKDKILIEASFNVLSEKSKLLDDVDQKILDELLEEENSDPGDIESEVSSTEDYKTKLEIMRVRIAEILRVPVTAVTVPDNSATQNPIQVHLGHSKNLAYPKMEQKKFSGELKDWLQFWARFKKIHDDPSIANEDKYQFLIQSMVEGTRASEIVASYPATAENYPKAIESLKSRFGREDVLIEVYVRELLKLVLSKSNATVTSIYDKLETHLRALESLNVTTEMCAAMLFPLVESSLPEEVLRTWQRQNNGATDARSRLEALMVFLKNEVRNEERISLVKQGLVSVKEPTPADGKTGFKKRNSSANSHHDSGVATAAGLLTAKETKKNICIFCQGEHENAECDKAKQIPLNTRMEVAKKGRACFSCLKSNHSYQRCRSNVKCAWCGHKHVLLMCRKVGTTEQAKSALAPSGTNDNPIENLSASNVASCIADVYLQTLRVKVKGARNTRVIRVLIDPGSHKSYVLKEFAREMNLEKIGQEKIVHLLFGGSRSEPRSHDINKLHLCSMDDRYECYLDVLQEEVICQNLPVVPEGPWLRVLKDTGVSLSDESNKVEPITLLLGADVAAKLYTGRIYHTEGPTAIETKLGWVLMGRIKETIPSRSDAALTSLAMFAHEAQISDLWRLDVLGITDPTETVSKEAHLKQIKEKFENSVRLDEEQRYEANLLWKENHPPLSSNRLAAENRLYKLREKLLEENLYEEYQKIFDTWLRDNVIEEVTGVSDGCEYFLPHRYVKKPESSTTPLRPVFDASAKCKEGPSLNQCLETGPNLVELIPSILLRFRENEIGVAADIAKAYLQVGISPTDRNVLKFLWFSKADPSRIIVLRHRRAVFGVGCSAFMLGDIILLHLKRALNLAASHEEQEMINKLMKAFYVDNCITSVETESKRIEFQRVATDVMRKAKFELRDWEFSGMNSQSSSVLGVTWNKNNDHLALHLSMPNELQGPITKKIILSIVHKIFDPLGWSCPTLLLPKLLLQRLCMLKIEWNAEVPQDFANEFKNWYKDISMLGELQVPRWIFGKKEDNVTLHVFVDASKHAYAAALFVRIQSAERVEVHLVQAKSRIGPAEKISIPRMELLAATIGARLEPWTRRIWKSRTGVILPQCCHGFAKGSNRTGNINPADVPSRGCTIPQLMRSRWWEGSSWLRQPSSEWPPDICVADEQLVDAEISKSERKSIRKESPGAPGVIVAASCGNVTPLPEKNPWYLIGISKYGKVVRMIAWLLRFVKNSRIKSCNLRVRGEISVDEYKHAERLLWRLAQQESFHGVHDERLKTLNTFLDQSGLIRTKTLVSNRDDDFGFRCPVVMDPKHKLTVLLIRHEHEKLYHAGVGTTMVALRENVWIITSRKAVRSVINNCVKCRRFAIKPAGTPPASLPLNRVRDASVFEVVGVDYAGPLYLWQNEKAWICLFTCAVYRAVHLELVTALSTDGFLEAFRRFISRRGRPAVIYSDNGTNFSGASRLLKTIDWKKIENYSSEREIQWKFNPPSAPWWGGWWERLVRILKDLLKRSLGRSSLNYQEMNTVLCDCESVINARPVSYLSESTQDLVAITPDMFLKERSGGMPDVDHLDQVSHNKRLRYQQRLREELRRRFREEYLGQLMIRSQTKGSFAEIREGDVVLVVTDTQKRLNWPLARVMQLIPGKDGIVRIARIKTVVGVLIRPLQRLIVLEGESCRGEIQDSRCNDAEPIQEEESHTVGDCDVQKDLDTELGIRSQPIMQQWSMDGTSQERCSRRGRVIRLPKKYR